MGRRTGIDFTLLHPRRELLTEAALRVAGGDFSLAVAATLVTLRRRMDIFENPSSASALTAPRTPSPQRCRENLARVYQVFLDGFTFTYSVGAVRKLFRHSVRTMPVTPQTVRSEATSLQQWSPFHVESEWLGLSHEAGTFSRLPRLCEADPVAFLRFQGTRRLKSMIQSFPHSLARAIQ